MRPPISRKRLLSLLRYNPDDGSLMWIKKPHVKANDGMVGRRAGTLCPHGYRQVRIDGKIYFEHRIIWLMAYGTWPKEIDHKNMVASDNRLENLRICTRSQNGANRLTPNHNLTTGAKGITLHYGHRYHVRVGTTHIGTCSSLEEAKEKYLQAARARYGEFARAE